MKRKSAAKAAAPLRPIPKDSWIEVIDGENEFDRNFRAGVLRAAGEAAVAGGVSWGAGSADVGGSAAAERQSAAAAKHGANGRNRRRVEPIGKGRPTCSCGARA